MEDKDIQTTLNQDDMRIEGAVENDTPAEEVKE